jgi:sortase A
MASPNRTRTGRFRRWMEGLLLLAGVAGLGAWAASNVVPVVSQDWENWVFDRGLHSQAATVRDYLAERGSRMSESLGASWKRLWSKEIQTPKVAPARNANAAPSPKGDSDKRLVERELVGRLEIPRLHLTTIVREGDHESTLSFAAGHIPGTAMPGESGNVGVAGHRDTLFRRLQNIQDNDLIQFETLTGSYVYQVESTRIVKPTEVSVLNPGPHSELTLVTCYPFTYIGSAPERFIVKARQVLTSSVKPDLSNIVNPAPAAARGSAVDSKAVAGPAKTSVLSKPSSSRSKVNFSVSNDHSRQLAPGISIGVTQIDEDQRTVNGWLWVMPDRRTIWVRNQPLHDPIVFYQDGKLRELSIISVSRDAAAGYLLLADQPNH